MDRLALMDKIIGSNRASVISALSVLFMPLTALAHDTGDAPASYGQATHEIVVGSPYLGRDAPDDNEPQFTVDALGDDNDGLDDEGGVYAFPVLVQNGKAYSVNVFASNPGDSPATLGGWVDFDGNGQFDTDEFATAVVPPGSEEAKFKLRWPDLTDISSDYAGLSYARFRVSTQTLSAANAYGDAPDGEVEDYTLDILLDTDGDERPDITDTDNDNDGIPDAVEGLEVDTDGDGINNYLDSDSDGDTLPDFQEAGEDPRVPADTDGDGMPDYVDLDSNNDGVFDNEPLSGDIDRDGISDALEGDGDSDADGVLDRMDLDSDNDTIPDSIEVGMTVDGEPADTDGDGIADYLDLDSDNDGIPDIREANAGELNINLLDTDFNGQVDGDSVTGSNGLANEVENAPDSGVPVFSVADTNENGIRDFRELDSDSDGVSDLLESGGSDSDGNGLVDNSQDLDQDGIADGMNSVIAADSLPDVDDDGIPDFQDSDADGTSTVPASDDPDVARVETGLSGGAGCSVLGSRQHNDTLFGLLLIVSALCLGCRRYRRSQALLCQS